MERYGVTSILELEDISAVGWDFTDNVLKSLVSIDYRYVYGYFQLRVLWNITPGDFIMCAGLHFSNGIQYCFNSTAKIQRKPNVVMTSFCGGGFNVGYFISGLGLCYPRLPLPALGDGSVEHESHWFSRCLRSSPWKWPWCSAMKLMSLMSLLSVWRGGGGI